MIPYGLYICKLSRLKEATRATDWQLFWFHLNRRFIRFLLVFLANTAALISTLVFCWDVFDNIFMFKCFFFVSFIIFLWCCCSLKTRPVCACCVLCFPIPFFYVKKQTFKTKTKFTLCKCWIKLLLLTTLLEKKKAPSKKKFSYKTKSKKEKKRRI